MHRRNMRKISERFEFLSKQKEDLLKAKDKILSAIDEMDEIMIKQFTEMFEKINSELNDVFRSLFGGEKHVCLWLIQKMF